MTKDEMTINEALTIIDDSQGCITEKELYEEYGKIELGQSLLEKE